MKPLELAALEAEITSLMAAYPELAEDETLKADMLEGSTDVFDVLDKIVADMQAARVLEIAARARARELADRASRFERHEEAMRILAEKVLRMAGLRKVVLPEATLSLRAVPPAVVIDDERELPEEFWRVKRTHNLKAIKAALDAGDFVPGASLSNGGETLAVRVS